jgi:hypothetical protein
MEANVTIGELIAKDLALRWDYKRTRVTWIFSIVATVISIVSLAVTIANVILK